MVPRPDRILDYTEYPVLYVDDEPENLRIFELTFRREFGIRTAQSGEEALEILAREPVAIVLSDHRMPGMTGVEFLARVHDMDPKTVRMLVTAYGDSETLGSAINSGAIYKFIPKPWQPEEMRVSVRRAIEAYALDREREQLLRELTLLNRVTRIITQELEFDRLVPLLLQILTEDLGYDGAALLFFDPQTKVLSRGQSAPADDSVAATLRDLQITEEGAPDFIRRLRGGDVVRLTVDDALGLAPALRDWITEVAADEILVMPLVGKRRTIGVLAVDNRRGGHRFRGDDETLLEGLANQAVVAIENARLVEALRRTREQVRRADRLGQLGTLAAGLAHEINNPLVSINTFLSMAPAKREEEDSEFWGPYHELACKEVDRIRGLVDTMRQLGRGGGRPAPKETVDVGELVREAASLLQREADKSGIALTVQVDPRTPKLQAVRDHLHQVFLNLLLNALHATPQGGAVRVETGPDPDEIGVRVAVSDSGPGIPEEHLAEIFDPFFTTKDPDQGSGLGLMICHRLVTDHGGTIEVQSAESGGATFCVRIPSDDMGAPAGPVG